MNAVNIMSSRETLEAIEELIASGEKSLDKGRGLFLSTDKNSRPHMICTGKKTKEGEDIYVALS